MISALLWPARLLVSGLERELTLKPLMMPAWTPPLSLPLQARPRGSQALQ